MTEKIRNAIVTQMDSNGPCLLAQTELLAILSPSAMLRLPIAYV